MSAILLSYRREDAAATAGRIADRLASEFGRAAVSRDASAAPGDRADARRAREIDEAVREASVILVVIGPRWLLGGEGRARPIDDPADVVRLHVEAALRHNKPLIPLLVQGAAPPLADLLPPSVRELAARLALPVRYDPDFARDMGRVVESVARWAPRLTPARRAARRAARLGALVVGVVVGVVGLAVLGVLLTNATPGQATTRVPTPAGPQTILRDPLTSNQHGWSTADFCKFEPDGFHLLLNANTRAFCGSISEDSIITTGTISVKAREVRGPASAAYGLAFHIVDVNLDHSRYTYYRFYVTSDGRWGADSADGKVHTTLVALKADAAIRAGVGAENTLAVRVTSGAGGQSAQAAQQTLTFLVNGTEVGSLTSDTYLAGTSGVGAETGDPADVAFSDYLITVP